MVRGLNPGGGEVFHSHSGWPWGASSLHNGYCVPFLEVKKPVHDVDHPSPSNAKVKERAELYLYFPLEPSSSVLV